MPGGARKVWDATLLLTSGSFLLTVELLCLCVVEFLCLQLEFFADSFSFLLTIEVYLLTIENVNGL